MGNCSLRVEGKEVQFGKKCILKMLRCCECWRHERELCSIVDVANCIMCVGDTHLKPVMWKMVWYFANQMHENGLYDLSEVEKCCASMKLEEFCGVSDDEELRGKGGRGTHAQVPDA